MGALLHRPKGSDVFQNEFTTRLERKLAAERTGKTDSPAFLVINNMLLTGFDAPVEQLMYEGNVCIQELLVRPRNRTLKTMTGTKT